MPRIRPRIQHQRHGEYPPPRVGHHLSDLQLSATFTDFITGSGLVTTTVENSVRIVGFETVTVPAGTFTALKIVDTEVWSSDAAPGITTSWLVSGLGIVKIVFEDGDGEELKHYVVLNAQPQAQTVAAGARATLSVTATGGGSSLTYQWRKDGVNVSGANASSYNLPSAQASHAGSYTVVVSNTAGSVTSSAATLTVNALVNVPTITTPPQSQVAIVTSNVTFTVAATGSGLTYQWRKDGVAIGNATSATLTLNSVTRAASGVYSVVVTSGGSSTTSGNATLRVIVPQQLSSRRGGSGQFQLLFTDPDTAVGSDLARFEVHHTANFLGASTVWVTNSGSFTLSSGKILFDDTGSVGTARRFYRVIEK